MLKREWGAESNEKLPHLSIPSKTAALVPEFAVKDLPLGRTLLMMIVTEDYLCYKESKIPFNFFLF